jgi:heme A synthase
MTLNFAARKLKKILMLTPKLIAAFLEQATAQGSKSTILRPLGWMLSICIAAILGAIYVKAESWIIDMFSIFCALTFLLFLVTYGYCLLTKRETLLRSETYAIQELAIQKGFVGDSLTGIFNLAPALAGGHPANTQDSNEAESQ